MRPSADVAPLDGRRGMARRRRALRVRHWSGVVEKVGIRAAECVVGSLGLIAAAALSPLAGFRLESQEFVGRYGTVHRRYRFAKGPERFRGLPTSLSLVRGDLALVGPRPLAPSETSRLDAQAFRRMDVRPGLISLHRLRAQTNIAFDDEFVTDAEYVERSGLKADLGLIARYMTTAWAADEPTQYEPELDILGVPVDNLTMPEAIDRIVAATEGAEPRQLCFVNADCMNLTFRKRSYWEVLRRADLVLADGIGLKIAGKILRRPIIQNVNGTDLFPRLCERLAQTGGRLYLLGGREGVPQAVRDWIGKNHPGVTVAGVRNGFFAPEELPEVLREVRQARPDVLLVAFGAPRQDEWIAEHLAETGAKVAMGVGGLFDFYGDRIPRAPLWMRELGLEWVYRLIQEPGRMWKRYLVGNVVFLYRVMRFRNRERSFE